MWRAGTQTLSKSFCLHASSSSRLPYPFSNYLLRRYFVQIILGMFCITNFGWYWCSSISLFVKDTFMMVLGETMFGSRLPDVFNQCHPLYTSEIAQYAESSTDSPNVSKLLVRFSVLSRNNPYGFTVTLHGMPLSSSDGVNFSYIPSIC